MASAGFSPHANSVMLLLLSQLREVNNQGYQVSRGSSTDLGSDMSEVWSALLRKHLISYGREVAISALGSVEAECLIHVVQGNARTPVKCGGDRGAGEASVAMVSSMYYVAWNDYISNGCRQPAQLADSWGAVLVPHCHYTAGDYQSNLAPLKPRSIRQARFRAKHGQPSTATSAS